MGAKAETIIAFLESRSTTDAGDTRRAYANLLYHAGRDQQALPLFDQLLREAKREPCLYGRMGQILAQLGDHQAAVEALRSGAGVYPKSGRLWWLLGQFSEQAGGAAAESFYSKAATVDPD